MDLLLHVLGTEGFDLKVHATGLQGARRGFRWEEGSSVGGRGYRTNRKEERARYLPRVLWAWLQRDGTREVERNLKEHSASSITF